MFEILPTIIYEEPYTSLVSFFVAINTLLCALNRKEQFQEEMKHLFNTYPNISLEKMGLNEDILKWLGYRL